MAYSVIYEIRGLRAHLNVTCDACMDGMAFDGDPHTDPFGGKIVCRSCWDQIIGGD